MSDAKKRAENILTQINFDFHHFTISGFIKWVSEARQREILTIPWRKMPPGLFGAWLSDADEPREYLFFRDDILPIHQTHVQLHELSHLLCEHPTLNISSHKSITGCQNGKTLPFDELLLLRSPKVTEYETEAETLASLIQEKVIQYARLDQLLQVPPTSKKLAELFTSLGLT